MVRPKLGETMTQDLREQREALADAESNAYSPDNFPGSRRWTIWARHLDALDVFDAAHPEIIATIEAERKTHDHQVAQDAGWI